MVETFTLRSPMPAPAEELYAWHTRPGAFLRLQPPWESLRIVRQEGTFGEGFRVTFRTSLFGPVKTNWVAEVHGVQPGREFHDRQVSGPFPFWDHRHTMIPDGPERSFLEDHVEYRLPLGLVGRLARGLVRRRLARMFGYRHALIASDLRRHRQFPGRPLTVAITGSRGLVGTELTYFLTTGGHHVVRFVRGPTEPTLADGTSAVSWDPEKPVDPRSLEGVDAIVHLAGENVAEGRWTPERKRRILESRTGPTRRLAEAIAALDRKPAVFVSASGISYYGDTGDGEAEESAPPGPGFLADVTRQWEEATTPAAAAGVRVAQMRIGVVLSPKGAALGKQLLAFRAGAGAVFGSGRQWVSWITLPDLVGAIHHTLFTPTLSGPINAVAPHPVTNRDFGRTLARVLRRPFLMTLPAVALRTMFGEVADEALLASLRIRPRKLLDAGFVFDHPHLEEGLRFLLGA